MAVVDELVALLGYDLQSEDDLRRFNKSLDDLSDKAYRVGAAMGRMAAIAGTAVAAGMSFLGKSVIDTSAKFESYAATLETIEGSAAGAQTALDWITDFAKTTPYEVDNLTAAFVKLRSYGLDPMDGSMTVLGDTASAMGKSIDQVVEAYADATTFQFERLKELGIVASQAGDEVTFAWTENGQRMTRTINKTSTEVTKFLDEVWGRKFSGAMIRQSKTWNGMMSNLGDSWTDFQRRIGDAGFFDVAKNKLGDLMDLIGQWQSDGTIERISDVLSTMLTRTADVIGTVVERIGRHVAFLMDNFERLKPVIATIGLLFGLLFVAAFPLTSVFFGLLLAVDDFLTYLEGGESVIGNFITWLRGLIPVTGEVGDALAWLAVSVTGALLAAFVLAPKAMVGLIIRGAVSLVTALGSGIAAAWASARVALMASMFTPLGQMLLRGLAMAFGVLTGPVGWAILAVSAGLLMYQFWDQIVAAWNIVTAQAGALFASAGDWFNSIDWSGEAIRLVQAFWGGLVGMWDWLGAQVGPLFAQMGQWWSDIDWNATGRAVGSAIVWAIIAGILNLGNLVVTAFRWIGEQIAAIDWAALGHDIVNAIVNAVVTIKDTIVAVFWTVVDAVKVIDWSGVGTAIVDAIILVLSGIGALIAGIFQGAAATIQAEIKAWFAIDLAAEGRKMAQSVFDGMKQLGAQISKWWADLIPDIKLPWEGEDVPTPTATGEKPSWMTGDSARQYLDNLQGNTARMDAANDGAAVVQDNSQHVQTTNVQAPVTVNVQQPTDAPAAVGNAVASAVNQRAQPTRLNGGQF